MMRRNAALVMNPSPPMKSSTRITASPNPVQYEGVSTTINPVTVIADTEVKSAVKNGVTSPVVLAMGSDRNHVPMAESARNP